MRHKSVRHFLCVLPAVLLALSHVPSVWASGTVTNCSSEANLNSVLSGGGTVTFACSGTMTLTGTKTISANTIINANGYDVTLNGQNGGTSVRLFYVNTNISLTIIGLRLVNGLGTNGGAVFNNGTVLATNCVFAFNSAVGPAGGDGATGSNGGGTGGKGGNGNGGINGLGGAVFSLGSASFTRCTFQTNSATGGAGGKGGNGGTGTVTGGDGGNGGAGGQGLGGAIYSAGSMNLVECSLMYNNASGGRGGDIGVSGAAPFSGVDGIAGIGAPGSGGAAYSTAGSFVSGCLFALNQSLGGKSANQGYDPNASTGPAGRNGPAGHGGALCNLGTNATVNCTFYGNSVRGGDGGNGGNSGTTAGNGGDGGHGWGGNLYNQKHAAITNCTFTYGAANRASNGVAGSAPFAGSNGSLGESRGGNVANSNGLFIVNNMILAYPSVGTNGYVVSGGSNLTDVGFCLSSDRSVTLNGSGSRTNTDPLLGPLTANGGPTLTMALLTGSPCIDAGDTNFCLATDQRGQPRPGGSRCDIGAFENMPSVVMFPELGWASEQGDVGIITVSRTDGVAPLKVYYTIGGSAVNGTDYVSITNYVTIEEGISTARIIIRPVADGSAENDETVNLTLQANAAYSIGELTNAVVTISDQVVIDPDKRYFRGTGTYPGYHSFVIPLDFQKGVRLAESGGNAATLFPGNPWTTNFYHFNATNIAHQTNLTGRLTYQNPIVSFGSRVGGSPLLINQTYRFGIYAGVSTSTNLSQFRLKVYNKTNMAVVNSVLVIVPPEGQSNSWHTFSTNGYSQMVVANGLTTFISRQSDQRWGVAQNHSYVMSHQADTTATAYIYEWEVGGASEGGLMVLNTAGTNAYSKLYTVEFDARSPWQAVFIHQPHFAGKPLPPDYIGKTTEELLTASTFLATNPMPSGALTWTNLDNSPELWRHPILDQFVSDLNRDPIALINYVFNEIELTDAFGYDDDGNVPEASVNPGGVNRSALDTYQEGQGSPIEQCALLVYLLRQAGYPAAYSFPADESLKLLDTRLSSILRLRLPGTMDEFGRTLTTNRLIAVNYPWVTTYIGTNWVHLFPWLKDTEVVEGFGLYDYMPTNYNNAYKWVRDYLYGKTNILALSSDDDTPATLFPKFVQQVLLTNAPGLSLDDIGVRIVNRRKNYSQWSDFPKPTVVGNSNVVVENLTSATLTNLWVGLTNIFDTVSVEIYSVANPTTKVVSGELRVADFHNRKFLARHEKITTNSHRLILSLAAYRPDTTNEVPFSAVDPYSPADADVLKRLAATNILSAADDELKIKFTHRRQRSLPSSFVEPNHWDVYPGFGSSRTLENEATFRKGDLAALCLDAGRVSRRMLQVHAEELWRMEQTLGTNSSATNTISADIYQGTPAYLKGMAYYEKVDRFTQVNERLHKVKNVSSFAAGVAKLRAAHNGSGLLPNGDIDLTLPTVDMFTHQVGLVGNGMVHPDSGQDLESSQNDYFVLSAADGSAQEHAIINQFLIQKEAISTVKLLRLAQQRGTNGQPGIILLTKNNYLFEGEKFYPTNGSTRLRDYDTNLWAEITATFVSINGSVEADYSQVFYTPWPVTNATASYAGMGALILAPHSQAGLISSSLNGAAGEKVPAGSFGAANSPNQELNVNANGDYSLATKDGTPASPVVTPEASSQADTAGDVTKLQNGSYFANPEQVTEGQVNGLVQNGQPDTFANTFDDRNDLGGAPVADDRQGNGPLKTLGDPVNTLTGEFYVDAADLTLPGPMPLQVRRNYGSHNLVPNQLGYGWKLNYMPFLTSSQGTNFYVSEPDGSVLVFVQIGTDLWAPTTTNNPTLNNYTTSGIGSVANRFNARIKRVFTGVNTYYLTNADGSLRIFEEKSFPLSAGIDRLRPYLTKWYDNHGNSYSFEYGTNSSQTDYGQVRRILSSNGNLLGFQYDVYGRITEAYALDGRRVTYRYDEHGDLVLVTLPDASEWQFEYQHLNWTTNSVTYNYSTHLLTKELKPDGRALQNEYDSLRRVTNQWATVGADLRLIRNATFRYTNNFSLTNLTALLTGTTTVLDYTNRVLRYFYTDGLIRNITDPLNQSIVQTWYEVNETTPPAYPRSLKTITDKRGLVTTFLYDDRGNATNTTIRGDLRGDGDTNATAVTLATFTTNNLPAKVVDPSGTTNLFFYTNNWLLVRVENWPNNATPSQVITNLFAYHDVTNAADGTVSYGLRQQEIRAAYSSDASTNEWDHDSRGFVTRTLRYTATADPNLVVNNLHNRRGELIERTDAIGRATRFGYDALSRPAQREVFEAGQSTPLAWDYSYYNPNGELVWSDGPRYDPEDYIWRDYDGAGRLCTVIRWRSQARSDGTGVEAPTGDELYSTTFFDYDPFGNQIRVTNPRGMVTTNSFDAIGQLLGRKVLDTSGTQLTSEGFGYEPGGQVVYYTNALGAVSQTLYTSTGKPKFRKNVDGSTNAWRYYEDGRTKREIQSNGAYWETTYNDAARTATRIFYSSVNVALATNVTELDRRGNVVRAVDAGGFISTNRFDALDRIKLATGPAIVTVPPSNAPPGVGGITSIVQQVSAYLYDSSGKVLTISNALGETVITTRDALDRVVRSELLNSGVTVRLTTTAFAANHYSATTTNGTGAAAIASTTYTDHDGNAVLSLRYPSANVVEFDWQSFDAVGNRVASQQASRTNSQVTVWSTNGWTYDGLNRVRTATVRDGATTTFSYNSAGNLTNRAMPGGLTNRATFNTAGQKLTEYDIGTGSLASRTNTYSYYASNLPYAGLLQTRTDGRGVVCTYTYDDWLRAATNTHTGSSNYHNLTTLWKYDARGLLTNVTESFASSTTGPPVAVRRSYDAYRLLTSELIYTNNVLFSSANQEWDSAGRRLHLDASLWNQANGDATYDFTWRADSLLASAVGHTGGGTYSYNDAGQLVSRTLGPKVTTITSRDDAGRPVGVNTTIGGTDTLGETLAYTGDGRIAAHSVTRVNTSNDYTDDRAYLYANSSRRLTEERLNLDGTKRWTNSFTFDNGQAAGPGVLTKAGAGSATLAQWSGVVDGLARMTNETNNVIRRLAYGRVNGPSTISASVDGQPMPVTVVGTGNTTWTNQWRATLDLTPGAHQLTATARHPSGQFITNAAIWFTNNASAPDRVEDIYDFTGNVTKRLWRSANGTTNRTQTLSWDARGRLYKVVERDNQTNGFDWTPVYDPFGRKLRTVEVPVTNGVSLTAQALVIGQYFDPLVRYLALGVSVVGKTTWKLMGPDLNGRYGGLQGRGGFDAIIPGPELFCPTINDARGNVLAVYDVTHLSLTWNQSRPTGYGAVPTYRPPALGHGADLIQASAFAGIWSDVAGYYWRGSRYYDPIAGRWLSGDPLGHDSDASLFTYANGDPINFDDPDGLLAKTVGQGVSKVVDLGVNLAVGFAFSASPEGATDEQRIALARIAIQTYGSPMRRVFGAYDGPVPWVDGLAAELTPTTQDAGATYVVGRNSSASPRYEPVRAPVETQWGAPLEPPSKFVEQGQMVIPGRIETPSYPEPGEIDYGSLDELGRPTGINATLTPEMIGTGTRASQSITPPGYVVDADYARGHLLGRQLGGSGTEARNLVTIFQNPANHPAMSSIEGQVRVAVEAGQTVNYSAVPVYQGVNAIPSGITIIGQGSGGFSTAVTILNRGR